MRIPLRLVCLALGGPCVVTACDHLTCEDYRTCAAPGDAGGDHVAPGAGAIDGASDGSASSGGERDAAAREEAGLDARSRPDTGPDVTDAPPPCDVTLEPLVESCLVADRYAVFVAPGGAGRGTKDAPVGSLARGIAYATQLGLSRVIVCDATYDEALSLTAPSVGPLTSALRIHGGFHCPGEDGGAAWAPEIDSHVVLAPSVPGPALSIDGIQSAVLIENVDFVSPDGSGAAPSSIAAVIASSSDVTLRRVNITAGKGADGAKGASGTNGANGLPFTGKGTDPELGTRAVCSSPPAMLPGGEPETSGTCGSVGGIGGTAYVNAQGGDGTAGLPTTNLEMSGLGKGGPGGSTISMVGAPGVQGADGLDGTASPSSSAYAFTASAFVPADGNAGTDGSPGQGGGGGGASMGNATCTGSSGGAGGMGGCGGTHGEGGKGGGASIAVLVSRSHLTLDATTLTAHDGGKGGDGGDGGFRGLGTQGRPGGSAEPGFQIVAAGAGAPGGDGGNGAPGSGGTGGPSYAIVSLSGSTLTTASGVTLTPGAGGDRGLGGTVLGVGGTNPALDGRAGLAGPELDVP